MHMRPTTFAQAAIQTTDLTPANRNVQSSSARAVPLLADEVSLNAEATYVGLLPGLSYSAGLA